MPTDTIDYPTGSSCVLGSAPASGVDAPSLRLGPSPRAVKLPRNLNGADLRKDAAFDLSRGRIPVGRWHFFGDV